MNTFQSLCQPATQDAADNAAQMLEREEAFGIIIPAFASEIASGFKLDTVAPTTNATQAGE